MSLSQEAYQILKKRYNFNKTDIKSINQENKVFLHQVGKSKPTVIKILSKSHNFSKMQRIFPCLQRINQQYDNPENIAKFKDYPIILKDNTMMFLIEDYGISMDKFLKDVKGPMQFAILLDISLQMAKGLAILQIGGVNHRDVKPSNFIIVEKVVKVIDFDISKPVSLVNDIEKAPTTTTFNQGTRFYFSPKRMCHAINNPQEKQHIGFRDDSYSLGLVYMQMMVKNTEFQKKFYSFQNPDGNRLDYKKHSAKIKPIINDYKANFVLSKQHQGFILLIENLFQFKQQNRIDLMAVYKFLQKLKNLKDWGQQQIKKFLKDEAKLSQERSNDQISKEHEKKYHYIQLEDPKLVCVSYNNDAIVIYDSKTKEYQMKKLGKKLLDGFGIALTNDSAYVMGGEEETTGKCLSMNLKYTFSTYQIQQSTDIIDDGRNLFAVSYSNKDNIIALSGGYKVHSKIAKNILIFNPTNQKWIKGPQLIYSKINGSACFTDTCFFTFGGLMGDYKQDNKYQKQIQYFLSKDIVTGNGKCFQLRLRRVTDDSMISFLTATAGLSIHMNGENILLLGGLGEKYEEDYADGYVLKIKKGQDVDDYEDFKHGEQRTGQMIQIKENMGMTKSTFYSPAVFYDNRVFVSFPDNGEKGAKFMEGIYDGQKLSFEEHWLKINDSR